MRVTDHSFAGLLALVLAFGASGAALAGQGTSSSAPATFGSPGAYQLKLALLQDDLDDVDDLDDESFDEDLEDELLDEAPAEKPAEDPAEGGVEPAGTKEKESFGGATGFVFPTGLYVSSDLGGFIRFGGYGDSRDGNGCLRCVPKLTSNLQPWIGLNVGYDFVFSAFSIGAEATLGSGFIADAAPRGYWVGTDTEPVGVRDSPENNAITMTNVAVTFAWYFLDRLALQAKLFAGGAFLSPDPDPARLNLVRSLTCDAGNWGDPVAKGQCPSDFPGDLGALVGWGLGLRYATLLSDVVIGFDLNGYNVWSMNVATGHTGGVRIENGNSVQYIPPPIAFGPIPIIPAVSFAPVLKYVF